MIAPATATQPAPRKYEWWAARGENPEVYAIVEPTRAAVIEKARHDFGPAAVFTIVEATQDGEFDPAIFDDAESIEWIAERFQEVNSDRWGEDGWEGFGCDENAEQELGRMLNAAFADWLKVHGRNIKTWTFTDMRNREVIPALPNAVPDMVWKELLTTALSTEQVIGRMGVLPMPAIRQDVTSQLRSAGYEEYPHRELFREMRMLWFRKGTTETIVVIHGAQRTGKTLNAQEFQRLYNCHRVQDWSCFRGRGHSEFPVRNGDLLLTTETPEVIRRALPQAVLVPVNDARRAIGLEPAPEKGFR